MTNNTTNPETERNYLMQLAVRQVVREFGERWALLTPEQLGEMMAELADRVELLQACRCGQCDNCQLFAEMAHKEFRRSH